MSTENSKETTQAQGRNIGVDQAKKGSKDITGRRKVKANGTTSQVVLADKDQKSHEVVRRSQAQNSSES